MGTTIIVDGYEENIHDDHSAFKKAIEVYRLEPPGEDAYSPTAKLVSKTYCHYRDGERPYYTWEFECNER